MHTLFTPKRLVIILGTLLVATGLLVTWMLTQRTALQGFPRYFSYNETVLKKMPRSVITEDLTTNELFEWDEKVFALVSEEKLSPAHAARLYAYLMTAEHDAVMLAAQAGNMRFTIAPLVKGVVCEFLPMPCERLLASADPYSVALADMVLAQVHARKEADAASVYNYPFGAYQSYWDTSKTYSGMDVGSWKPWRITNVQSLREPAPPAPDSPEGIALIQEIITALANLSAGDRDLVLANAMPQGTGTVSANTLKNLAAVQRVNGTELIRTAHERMLLSQAVMDALVVAYDTKYSYWYPRPNALSADIHPVVQTPGDPSYPSTSVSAESAGTTLMQAWYPAKRAELDAYMLTIENARVHAGIHNRNDVNAAARIGKKVAGMFLNE